MLRWVSRNMAPRAPHWTIVKTSRQWCLGFNWISRKRWISDGGELTKGRNVQLPAVHVYSQRGARVRVRCFVTSCWDCYNILATRSMICCSDSKSLRVMSHRTRTRKTLAPAKTEAVRAVADSTQERSDLQRKSARTRKHKIPKNDSSEDSDQVSADSYSHRREKVSRKQRVLNEIDVPRPKEPISSMGRQIPLTFTAQGNTLRTVTSAEFSNEFKEKTTGQSDSDADHEDSNILMRDWLERKANRGDLPGLQWHDKSQQLVKISWKHGSKSGWTSDDAHVFISWARCTGWKLSVIVTIKCVFHVNS